MNTQLMENAEIFKLLSNSTRLCILVNLVKNKSEYKNVSQLMQCINSNQSSVSQQLTKLRLAGVIEYEKRGNEVYYKLKNEKIKKIIEFMFNI